MIRLHTLGAMELRDSERQELRAVLAQPKRMALLAYLALATPRGFHPRETLLALFWPEHDSEHARNSLNQSVHALRRALGTNAIVSRNGDAIGLEAREVWCDAVAFEEALDAGRLADALELYRGALLEGFHVTGAPEFERWLAVERNRFHSRYVKAAETLAREREAAADFESAATLWRRLTARDPYSSRLAVGLMRALAASGDPGAAVQHARVHEALLREELNVAPDPEVLAFVKQLESRAGSDEGRPQPESPMRLGLGEDANSANAQRVPLSATADAGGAGVLGSSRRSRHRVRTALMVAAAVVALGIVGAAIKNGTPAASIPLIRSIAVLPFDNLAGDSAQQSFGDGMHDALITELARYAGLRVISRTSMLQYKGSTKSLPQIARELNVDGVVEGAVLHEGGQVRMTVQLLHGPSDQHLWAESYKRDLRDVLLLQSELAEAIAREVRVATSPIGRTRQATRGPPGEAPRDIYLKELFLRGRHAEADRSPQGTQTAREFYRMAIDRDSTFALGYAGLAGIYEVIAMYGYGAKRPALDSARMMARRAVALDSTAPETRTALGMTLAAARDYEGAERELRRAIELSPSNARAHYWYAVLLVALGRGEDALLELERTAQLDPFAPRGAVVMQRYATFLATGQRPHLNAPPGKRWGSVSTLVPGEPWVRALNAVELAGAGQCTEARREILVAQQVVPAVIRMLHHAAFVHRLCGDHARARAIMDQMKRHPAARDHGLWIAMVHASFGEKDSAFVWLGRQLWTMAELTDPRAFIGFDSLRSDPRYAELLRELGLRPDQN